MAKADPIKIDSDRLLLCEGKTTKLVLGPLRNHFQIQGFQPLDFEGKDNLGYFLEDIVILPGFSTLVKTIGIVRDAEADAASAFASAQVALKTAKLPVPQAAGMVTEGPLRVGVFIVPDNASPGMIETLCMKSVDDDPAFSCVEKFFACVEKEVGVLPTNMHKARAQAFLTTRKKVEYHVGRAADNGIWNFDHAAFSPLVEFFRSLSA